MEINRHTKKSGHYLNSYDWKKLIASLNKLYYELGYRAELSISNPKARHREYYALGVKKPEKE